ncbi:MAG: hypothetical protein OXG65_16940 [Chloroflexi bacterium]|nr:hypothetical protein [Chloroflexota bacterium]
MTGDDVLTARQMLRIVLGLALIVIAVIAPTHAVTIEALTPTQEFRQAMWVVEASIWWLAAVVAVLRQLSLRRPPRSWPERTTARV